SDALFDELLTEHVSEKFSGARYAHHAVETVVIGRQRTRDLEYVLIKTLVDAERTAAAGRGGRTPVDDPDDDIVSLDLGCARFAGRTRADAEAHDAVIQRQCGHLGTVGPLQVVPFPT